MSAPSGDDFTNTWNLRAGSPSVVTRLSTAWRPVRYFQPANPPPASTSTATSADGNLDLGARDAGADPTGSIGIGCAPETVRDTGGTVRERVGADCPPPVEPRDSDRWLPVRGAGMPPSV